MQAVLIVIGIVIVMATTTILVEKKIEKEGGHTTWIWEIKK